MCFPTVLFAAIGDTVTTNKEIVGEISVSKNGVVYFVSEDGDWNAPGCPNLKYVYFYDIYPGGDKTFSAALVSKESKQPISFVGICRDTSGNGQYIQLTYMRF